MAHGKQGSDRGSPSGTGKLSDQMQDRMRQDSCVLRERKRHESGWGLRWDVGEMKTDRTSKLCV